MAADWFVTVQRSLAENGYETVGIAEASDQGLPKEHYTRIAPSCLREVKATGMSVPATANAPEVKGTDFAVKFVRMESKGLVAWDSKAKAWVNTIAQGRVDAPMIRDYIRVNYRWVTGLGLPAAHASLFWGILMVQFMHGLFDADEEAEHLVERGTIDAIEESKVDAVLAEAKQFVAPAKLLCAAAVINHYKINHTIGQGGPQGFVRKVVNTLDWLRPADTMNEGEKRAAWKRLGDFLYLALHRIGKRTGAMTLFDKVEDLYHQMPNGYPIPVRFHKDDFVSLRAAGAPAGAGKVYVAATGLVMMGATGVLAFSPVLKHVDAIKKMKKAIVEKPFNYHTGARWYHKFYGAFKAVDFSQNNEAVSETLAVVSIFVHYLAKGSTLNGSPAIADLFANARVNYAGFDAICRTYAEARDKVADSTQLALLLKVKTATVEMEELAQAFKDYADNPEEGNAETLRDALDALTEGL